MKITRRILVLALIAVSILSCARNKEANRSSDAVFRMAPVSSNKQEAPPPPPTESAVALQDTKYDESVPDKRKIIKDGSIRIGVDDIAGAKKETELLVKKSGGYIAEERFDDGYGTSEYTLKLRFPSANFDTVVKAVEHANKNIISKNITARDVSEEFIDLETRLSNKRNYLARYNDLLKQAKTVEDILKIEENTRVIEEEIESTEGKLKFLNDQVSFSTLEIGLVLKKDISNNPVFQGHFFKRSFQAIISGWYGAVEFLIILLRIWPLWIATAITLYFVIKFRRRTRMKNKV